MFSRASQVLHVYSRCRNKTKTYSLQPHRSRWQNAHGTKFRWNSSAAALKEERDGDSSDLGSDSQYVDDANHRSRSVLSEDHDMHSSSPKNDHTSRAGDNIHISDSDDGLDDSRGLSATRFRHWRPPKTAAMGVNFLGKPGEILLLSETGRRKQRRESTSIEEEEEEDIEDGKPRTVDATKRESVYEAVRNEHKSMSNDEIMTSIDSIRKGLPLAEPNSVLEVSARKLLEKSFSKTQLDTYIRKSAPKGTKLPDKTARRTAMAAYIVQHIWCLNPQGQGWNIQLSQPVKELIRLLKQAPSKYNLRTVSETAGGFKGTNAHMRQTIEKLAEETVGPRYLVKPRLLQFEKSASPEQSLVQSWGKSNIEKIARNNLVLLKAVTQKSPKYQLYAFSRASMSNFLREWNLICREITIFAQSLRPVELDTSDMLLPRMKRESISEGERHFRLRSIKLPEDPKDNVLTESMYARLQKTMLESSSQFDTCKELNLDPKLRNRMSVTFSAEFGKVDVNQFVTSDSSGKLQTTFSSQIPFLSQYLSQYGQSDNAASAARPLTLFNITRILFKPRGSITVPDLEIYADMSDRNNILILQMNLQFPQLTEILPMPGIGTDIRIARRETVSLFNKDEAVEEYLAPLIGSIAEQLPCVHEPASLYEPGNLNVNYFIILDPSALSTPLDTKEKRTTLTYTLETAQNVQVSAIESSRLGFGILEHTSSTPAFKSLLSEPLQCSQTLRLVEDHTLRHGRPLPVTKEFTARSIGQDPDKLRAFVKHAHHVAVEMSQFAKATSQDLVARYPRVE